MLRAVIMVYMPCCRVTEKRNLIQSGNPSYCCLFSFFFFYSFYLFYLFLAVLVLRCGEQGLLFVEVRGLLIAVASLVAEHGL